MGTFALLTLVGCTDFGDPEIESSVMRQTSPTGGTLFQDVDGDPYTLAPGSATGPVVAAPVNGSVVGGNGTVLTPADGPSVFNPPGDNTKNALPGEIRMLSGEGGDEADGDMQDALEGLSDALDKIGKIYGYIKTIKSIIDFIKDFNSPDPLDQVKKEILASIENETDRELLSDAAALVQRMRDLLHSPHPNELAWDFWFQDARTIMNRMSDVIVQEPANRAVRLSEGYNLLVLVAGSAFKIYGYSDEYVAQEVFYQAERTNLSLLGPYLTASHKVSLSRLTFSAATGKWVKADVDLMKNALPLYREDGGKILEHFYNEWKNCKPSMGSGCIGESRASIIHSPPSRVYTAAYRKLYDKIWTINQVYRLALWGDDEARYLLAPQADAIPLNRCYEWKEILNPNFATRYPEVGLCTGKNPTWVVVPLLGNRFMLRDIAADDAVSPQCLLDPSRYDTKPPYYRNALLENCDIEDERQHWIINAEKSGRDHEFELNSLKGFWWFYGKGRPNSRQELLAKDLHPVEQSRRTWSFVDEKTVVFSRETSEEKTPIYCPTGSLISGFNCRGKYCDNLAIGCQKQSAWVNASWWTSEFSEEGGAQGICSGGFVTGVQCKGKYCDKIRLRCATVSGNTPHSCKWTATWHSEEQGRTLFDEGYALTGIKCQGSYCDNKKFYVCKH